VRATTTERSQSGSGQRVLQAQNDAVEATQCGTPGRSGPQRATAARRDRRPRHHWECCERDDVTKTGRMIQARLHVGPPDDQQLGRNGRADTLAGRRHQRLAGIGWPSLIAAVLAAARRSLVPMAAAGRQHRIDAGRTIRVAAKGARTQASSHEGLDKDEQTGE
jgi:hypothetical protein